MEIKYAEREEGMRKQNSKFLTAFISEAGSELENNDYFAFVELDKYACYVIGDGLNDYPDEESALLAIETVLLAFQEHPSMKKRAILSYLKAGNKALQNTLRGDKKKASVTMIVTNYEHIRYACAGNARFRMYRNGIVKEQSLDMSLGGDLAKEEKISKDALAAHEERNNLQTWMGQGERFQPFVSKKIKLEDGDILNLYTRGVWENLDEGELDDVFSEAKEEPQESLNNIEDMLLSKQPKRLENYTFASIFVNKVFLDPNRKKRIKKMTAMAIAALTLLLIASIVLWTFYRQRVKRREEMEEAFANAMDYIKDNNYIRAKEECKAAAELAKKLGDKEREAKILEYLKLLEAVNKADEEYGGQNYERAQESYKIAKERSRYADNVSDAYIDKKLEELAHFFSVFDQIRLGDALLERQAYTRAEEKYLEARRLATSIYFEKGRKDAMEALSRLYEELAKEEEKEDTQRKEAADTEAGAAQLIAMGDKAFGEGDYEGAKVYYTMAMEKYRELEDEEKMALLETKLNSSEKKAKEKEEKMAQAEGYIEEAKKLEEEGDYEKAKKKYLQAKEIYKELQEEDKASQVDNRIDMLHAEKEEKEKEQEQEQEQEGSQLPGQIQSQMQGQGQGLNGTGQNGNGQLPPVQITVSGNATFNPHE